MANNRTLGKKGELIAVKYLKERNFKILHSNWFYGHKELDLVAVRHNVLHIIEVKTRSVNYWQLNEAVNYKKQKNIIEASQAYIEKYNIDLDIQFDILFIIYGNTKIFEIEYIPDAFSIFG